MASELSVQHQYEAWNQQKKTFERLIRTSALLTDELKEKFITSLAQRQGKVDAAVEALNQGEGSEQQALDAIRDGLLWIAHLSL